MEKFQIIGDVCKFNPDEEEFSDFNERLEMFFLANGIVDDKQKCAIFISSMSASTFKILKSLISPKKVNKCAFKDVIKCMSEHYCTNRLVITERYKFYKYCQEPGQSIPSYIAKISELASHCRFEDFLDQALRDKFVCGLSNNAIRSKLLDQDDNLSFKEACDIAKCKQVAMSENENILMPSKKSDTYMENVNVVQNRCKHCGYSHSSLCKFRRARCHKCKELGHIAPVCEKKNVKYMQPGSSGSGVEHDSDLNEDFQLLHISQVCTINHVNQQFKEYKVRINVLGKNFPMCVDTGSPVSIISCDALRSLDEKSLLQNIEKSSLSLKSYSGNSLNVIGMVRVPVEYKNVTYTLPMTVVESDGIQVPALLGRDWIHLLNLDLNFIRNLFTENEHLDSLACNMVNNVKMVEDIKTQFPNCFSSEPSCIKGAPVDIVIKPSTIPIFCKARPIPFALKDLVIQELNNLIDAGILKKVESSEWATPIVSIPKETGECKTVRICGDFSQTINKYAETQFYPLPIQDEILSDLALGKVFTAIDLCKAFHQLEVSEESQKLLTINTPMGLLQYTKLPYGVKSASFIFQKKIDELLRNCRNVRSFIDDVFIIGDSVEDCYKNTVEVFKILNENNVKVNINKCHFFQTEIKALGHIVSHNSIKPEPRKCDAIKNAPTPKNVTELKSYLGLLGYYQKFIPNLSFLLQPMYELLKKDKKWNFNSQCSEAFETSKLLLEKYNILVPFNETKPLVLQCDSSDYGIGAVLGHDYGDDVIRPIHFASKTLSSAERNYSQVQKEALAVIYGVQYFSKYLTGRKFTLITDNKALVTLFGEDKAVPMLSSARLQRWSLILSNFDYSIKYKKGTQIPVADALSRLPLSNDKTFDDTVYYLGFKELGLTANTIINSTRKDKVLSKVMEYVKHGWPSVTNLSCDEKTFHTIKDELSIENDLLLRANRIIIPDDLKEQILKLLHDEHPGIVRMKALARSYVWFPGIDKEIENYVKSCSACQAQSNNAQESLLTYWPQTSYPFQRIHIDYAEYDKKNLFIICDAFSKWIEVEVASSTDSKSTIQCLERFFSNFGFPETCVSDNGPQLVSKEMVDFMENNSITMVNSPPYHPKSNGAAERAVQVVKRHLEKQEGEKEKYSSFKQRVTSLLHVYRNTPHSVTGKSPAEMIFKFTPKIKLGKLKQVDPVKDKVTKYQEYQKKHVNQNRSINYYQVNEKVWVRSVRGEKVKWFPGHIVKIMSPYTYTVETEHQSRLVHADHLKKFEVRRSTRVSRPPPRFSF
ncbi:hypothetical protein M8J77_010808 [Diaphorina citri]|nr:hypothetical protein M8J77_010808 [Diaphorina citri]